MELICPLLFPFVSRPRKKRKVGEMGRRRRRRRRGGSLRGERWERRREGNFTGSNYHGDRSVGAASADGVSQSKGKEEEALFVEKGK